MTLLRGRLESLALDLLHHRWYACEYPRMIGRWHARPLYWSRVVPPLLCSCVLPFNFDTERMFCMYYLGGRSIRMKRYIHGKQGGE